MGKTTSRIVNCQVILEFNLVSEVPGCELWQGKESDFFSACFCRLSLGLEAVNSYQGWVSRRLTMGSSPKEQLYSKHIAQAAATWFVLWWGMQQQVRNKEKEAKIKMQALVWVVQPAHLWSSEKKCSKGNLSVWQSLTFHLSFCPQNPNISQYNCFCGRDATQDLALPPGFSYSSPCTPTALKWCFTHSRSGILEQILP